MNPATQPRALPALSGPPSRGWLGGTLAALLILAAEPGLAADWTVGMTGGWRTGRIGRDPGVTQWNSRYDAFLTPRLMAKLDGEATHVKLAVSQEALIRRMPDGQPQLMRPRLGAGAAQLQMTQVGRLGMARIHGRYSRSTSPLDAEAPVATVPGGYATWATGARATLNRIEGAVGFDGWAYEDPSVPTSLEGTGEATLIPVRWGTNAALLGWRRHVIGVNLVRTLRSDLAVVGLRRALGPKLAAQIEGGVSEVKFALQPPRRGPGFSVSFYGPEADLGPVNAICTVQPGLPVAVTVAGRRSTPGLRTSIRWESGVDAEGGWRRPPNLVRRIAVAVEDTLLRTNLLGGEVSGARLWSMSPPTEHRDALRFTGWFARRVQPWLTMRVDYTQAIEGINTGLGPDATHWYRLGASLAVAR